MGITAWQQQPLGFNGSRRPELATINKILKALALAILGLNLSACQIGYLMESAVHQANILRRRVPITTVLKRKDLAPSIRHKLKLALEARKFAEDNLGLVHTKNYTTYVQLDRPYVTWAVSAAPKWKLKHYLWYFPIVGRVPYLGFFRKNEALSEAKRMKTKGYDTEVRGVSAYSSLGWFNDPLLSSMLAYSDYDLVDIIIHETTHATIFIKSSADFNEQLATFVGNTGAALFYLKKEGPKSPTLAKVNKENEDDRNFSVFITGEIDRLGKWYKSQPKPIPESIRKKRFAQIQKDFTLDLKPKLLTDRYDNFAKVKLNNAVILDFETYYHDLSQFQKAYDLFGKSIPKLIAFCKKLRNTPDPASKLSAFIKSHKENKAAQKADLK